MFDITPDELSQLNDIDLRELVGRLCEAELVSLGFSPAGVTWGGNQTAADGGLDVRVALAGSASIDGFIPRRSTGFQVKTPRMARAAILAEMRPTGTIRPIIQELADEAGAYVIVSSRGSTADSALRNRRNALRDALDGVTNGDQLHTDFYDRTRLATWVRRHPGLIPLVKEKLGKSLVGWRAYGAWSSTAEGIDAEYLLDDKLRLHLGRRHDAPMQSVVAVIDELRDELLQPGTILRLVGLSGVGKTRLVQALFDARVGARPLPPSLAIYTNMSDNPDPQPTGLASDLMANRTRAILIVDNCPADLHRRLSELCRGEASTISVLTVEYDIRDDQPEGTQVVTLDTSSPELIEKLVRRRYTHLSQVDARTIAEASGGNARIAIALAETIERSDTIAGLSNNELFERLFRQRQDPDNALLLAAQACALVYSFQGEALAGKEAELPHLAALAGQTATETYRHVGELLRRNLVQQRSVWRAVLPHAIANRLAARALEDTPYDLINAQLIDGGTDRLARSFSRRLSFLHDQPKAVAIVVRWLAPAGRLGNVADLSSLEQAMFDNVASVMPEAALEALERVGTGQRDSAPMVWRRHRSLLRSLAYDPRLFERSTQLLAKAAIQSTEEREAKQASDTLTSLFTIYLSGTHATIEQRLGVIERLLRSGEDDARALGLDALDNVLEATHFTSHHRFEFGARSRDYGYWPECSAEVTQWYAVSLMLIERLVLDEGWLKHELRDLVARNFRGLWTSAHMYEVLERLFREFAADEFWREGWAACRQTIQFDKERLTSEAMSRLVALEADLRPCSLAERVRAVVLGNRSRGLDLEDMDIDADLLSGTDRVEAIARELGAAVAVDKAAFAELLPDLLLGGTRAWSFGRGLASACPDLRGIWVALVQQLERIVPAQRNVQVLRGFLSELWDSDRVLAQHLLDSAFEQPVLLTFFPLLHSAVRLDKRGAQRLERALRTGQVPIGMYQNLAFGRTTDHLAGTTLKSLLLLIADQSDGFEVALEILYMRLCSDVANKRKHDSDLIEAGRNLLRRVTFERNRHRDDYELAAIAKACLTESDAGPVAAELAVRLRRAVEAYEIHALENNDLLKALLEVQPMAVLDAWFAEKREQHSSILAFNDLLDIRASPADAISCDVLLTWCERDSVRRYPLAAAIITFAQRPEPNAPKVWSEHAKALIRHAPDRKRVLAVLIKRFAPMSWSGSRAALIEANARLLDSLDSDDLSGVMSFVTEAKAQLAQMVARERESETKHDQARDERFE